MSCFQSIEKPARSEEHAQELPCFRSLTVAKELCGIVKNAQARNLLHYYMSIHPQNGLPSRKDFDPMVVPASLPNITLVDVMDMPYRFRFRLAGTEICYNWGRELAGKYLDEIVPTSSLKHPHLDRVSAVCLKQPIYRKGKPDLEYRNSFKNVEYLHLPLAQDGINVDMILTYVGYGVEI